MIGMQKIGRKGLHILANRGLYQRLPDRYNNILMYHSVGGSGYDSISPDLFRSQIEWMKREYEIVDLPEVLNKGQKKRISITFDDGYISFYKNVRPILQEYSVPATVFVVGGAVRDPPSLQYMTTEKLMAEEHLKELMDDPLIAIGSHTMSHPPLAKIDEEEQLREEITGGANCIESKIGVSIDRFAYPYNNWSKKAHEIVRDRHKYAVLGRGYDTFLTGGTDPCLLPRINGAVSLSSLQFDISDTRKYLSQIW